VDKLFIEHFHLKKFSPHPGKYNAVVLTDEEPKEKALEDDGLNNDVLLD